MSIINISFASVINQKTLIMKVIIENPIKFYTTKKFMATMLEFAEIIQDITCAKSVSELKRNIESEKRFNFIYGYGGSHMWVKQINNHTGESGAQVIFVEF